MELITVRIEKPADTNFILGQAHFIKTVAARMAATASASFPVPPRALCHCAAACAVRSAANTRLMAASTAIS
jgi:adenosine/AMP kinase